MKSNNKYYKWLKFSVLTIYLIIIAGAVVRMTGSGMGCPDWPKCFGYLVPPTSQEQLDFKPEFSYGKGMVIIHHEELFVAKKDFISEKSFNASSWEKYKKHDYSVFNKYHTWTEYINRLIGAIGGLVIFILVLLAIPYLKTQPIVFYLSLLTFFAMIAQGILGKVVVDTVLSPVLISIHMIVALLIVGVLMYLVAIVSPYDSGYPNSKGMEPWAIALIILSLIQVVLGTQVRQHVDEMADIHGFPLKSIWLNTQSLVFYIHRSFSIVLLIANAIFIKKAFNKKHNPKWYIILALLLVITTVSGILMNYFDFPFGTQAIHLVIASLILAVQFHLWMKIRNTERVSNSNSTP